MEKRKIKILIADDHPVVREGLKQILQKADDMEIAGEALNGNEVLAMVDAEGWDVVVLDLSMPGRDGLEVLKEIKRVKPKLPVLMLSMHPEEQIAMRTFKLGASGYMNKETAPKELEKAIRKIYGGGKYVSAALAELIVSGLDESGERLPHEGLSDREFQVMRMLSAGMGVDEIGSELFISVKTVRTYRERVLEKLRLKNDVEIARYAIKHNLV